MPAKLYTHKLSMLLQMEAVNCILISRKDQEATNGVVHMIDSPLDPTLFMPRDVVNVVEEVVNQVTHKDIFKCRNRLS